MKNRTKIIGAVALAALSCQTTTQAQNVVVNGNLAVTNSSKNSTVGVNTNTPAALLHIAGNGSGSGFPQLRLDQWANGDYSRLRFVNYTYPYWDIAVGGGSADVMNFFANGYGNVMTLSPNGNVGIGTTSPSAPLQVVAAGQNGIYGQLTAPAGVVNSAAVVGIYTPTGAYGALGVANYTPTIGVVENSSYNYIGVYGNAPSGEYAGWFDGEVIVAEELEANGPIVALSSFVLGAGVPLNNSKFDVEANNAGDSSSTIAYFQNNYNGSGDSAPALRVIGNGNTAAGALSVSANGTGLIAQFGNNSSYVADIKVNGAFDGLSFNTTSDRNAKENFSPVDAEAVLKKVAALPISEWTYKAAQGVRHIGPMAQDFQAAFNVGEDDKHIATVDADGVALAAIQGLNQKVEGGESQIADLKAENAELKARLNRLERLLIPKGGGAQ